MQSHITKGEADEWFDESHAKNQDGSPKRLYHGTQYAFTRFDPEMQGANINSEDIGFFFTNYKKEADAYASMDWDVEDPHPTILHVHLSIKNPMVVTLDEGSPYEVPATWYDELGRQAVQDALESGHDGLIVRDAREWKAMPDGTSIELFVVFDPNQIRVIETECVSLRSDRTRKPREL